MAEVVTNEKMFNDICEKIDSVIDDLKSDIADTLGVEYEGKEETLEEGDNEDNDEEEFDDDDDE